MVPYLRRSRVSTREMKVGEDTQSAIFLAMQFTAIEETVMSGKLKMGHGCDYN